ncbi:hypothetical protein RND59_16505 [Vibrio ruber]|uniref:hypothetical protein n=1 Tax=Vibrio ruber TaxID=184755 RepID=UPI0028935E71|nr:hypothetical protein [Vibrio ruber]WNJ97730.1 hypothetical protein RND59_16505 [Vibrio ruber]
MKQENRFVADLYHLLSPFMDKDKDLYLCMDGGGAKHHAASEHGKLEDAVLPDIWFCLVGQEKHIGIEAKVFDSNNLSFRQMQIQSWRSDGSGIYTPHFWVATNRELTEYKCWFHKTMVARLNTTMSTVDNVSLSMSKYPADHESNTIQELALFILQNQYKSA